MAPLIVVALLLAPAAADVQEPVSSFDQLNTRLKVGDKIRIVDSGGKATKGVIEGVEAAALLLRQGTREPRRFPAPRVREVHTYVTDSIKNGIIAGSAVGAVGGFVLLALASGDGPDSVIPLLGGFAAAGALIGGTIDSERVRTGTVLYRAPGVRPSAHLYVAPLIARTRKGVAVLFSF
jgi:uncharacterized protein YcfJ